MLRIIRQSVLAAAALPWLLLASAAPAGAEDALDRIARTGEVRLALRGDAPPFSSVTPSGEVRGYSVDLCEAVVAELATSLNRAVATKVVPVTGANRLDTIAKGEADILCEATTYTLSRQERMDFSLITFITGVVLAVRRDSPLALGTEHGLPRRVGVLRGTTAEAALRQGLAENPGHSTLVPMASHDEAIPAILSGAIDGYAADREVILAQMLAHGAADQIAISDQVLSYEPYALAFPPGERRLKLAADRALAGLYRTGAIRDVLLKWFGERAWNDPTVRIVFRLQAIPE